MPGFATTPGNTFPVGTGVSQAPVVTGPTAVSGPSRTVSVWAIGGVKVWNGSIWVYKPVKVWSGAAWVQKPVKVWTGSVWKTLT